MGGQELSERYSSVSGGVAAIVPDMTGRILEKQAALAMSTFEHSRLCLS